MADEESFVFADIFYLLSLSKSALMIGAGLWKEINIDARIQKTLNLMIMCTDFLFNSTSVIAWRLLIIPAIVICIYLSGPIFQ